MVAVGAALVLTLAACGGAAGTPTGPEDPAMPVVSSTDGSSTASSTTSAASSTASSTAASTASDGSGASDGSSAESSSTVIPGSSGAQHTSGSDLKDSGGSETATVRSPDIDNAPDITSGGSNGTGDVPDVISSLTPTPFDARTTAWFAVMCTSLSSASAIDIPTYPYVTDGGTEPPLEQTRTRALADYAALHSTFTAAVTSLDGTPPPTLDGGGQMASDVLASLRAMAAVASDAPDALGGVQTSAELQSAMDDLHHRMRDASNLVPDDSPLVSDEVTAAMAQMPECQPLLGD
jgi:hypothetical protein